MNMPPCYFAVSEPLKALLRQRDSNLAAANFFRAYLSNWGFDEDWYLRNNPDLASAIPSADFPDAFSHFWAAGYFEGRLPVRPDVDESWYMTQYPDVAAAIIQGVFANAAEHFLLNGYQEGRLPRQPKIDATRYARAYLDTPKHSAEQCREHFLAVGYLNGALPHSR